MSGAETMQTGGRDQFRAGGVPIENEIIVAVG